MRGVTDVSGLRDIRSMHSTSRRSIPRAQSSAYLELYTLEKEKERLDKEEALLTKRRHGIQKRLAEIRKQMESLERSAQSGCPSNGVKKAAEPNSPTNRKLKTLALRY